MTSQTSKTSYYLLVNTICSETLDLKSMLQMATKRLLMCPAHRHRCVVFTLSYNCKSVNENNLGHSKRDADVKRASIYEFVKLN